MTARKRGKARRLCKRCKRPIATPRELASSYDEPRPDRCYVAWSVRDIGLRPAQHRMAMTVPVKAMAKDLALARARERLAECDAARHLCAAKLLVDLIAESPKFRR